MLLKRLNKQVLTYYVKKRNGDFPELNRTPISEILKQIKILNESYYFLVSILLKQNYNASIKIRLSSNYIPKDIAIIQQLFIESPAIRLLGIQKIKNIRYFKSSKNFKVSKNLSKITGSNKQIKNFLIKNVFIENNKLY